MLYDELVPDGKYLAHYGVPKDQWSPEAKARHNRNHPNKTVDPGAVSRTVRVLRNTYNQYQEDNHNRGGNRSTFGSKVDEQRFQLAEARRRANERSNESGNKPYDGLRTPDYRKPRRHENLSKAPSTYAKPGNGSSSGNVPFKPRRDTDWGKPGESNYNAKKPGPGTSRSYSSKALPSKGTPGKGKPNKNTPTAKDTYTKGTYTKDTPNNKDTMGRKYSYGRKPSRSKNAHSGGGYSDRANNMSDRSTGNRTLHGGNAGPGSWEQTGANSYRRRYR